MTLREALQKTSGIYYPENAPAVVKTAAREFLKINPKIVFKTGAGLPVKEKGHLVLDVSLSSIDNPGDDRFKQTPDHAVIFQIDRDGGGILGATNTFHFYSFICHILENLLDRDVKAFEKALPREVAFHWQRVVYDYFLTQEGRIQRNFNRESYVQEMARLGFTHVEVNGLAFPEPLESGPAGETYPMFYTYCPALDQFVSSELNQGLYPHDYLSANLAYLKENARLAVEFGLIPGLLCFEPRSVPEQFFETYPMLRGARVDHPFRSFKPRYNMTIAHPRVQNHYREMLQKIMREIPEMGYVCIWTNDSGAGFEHTKSLYVGRNGGAYLIREWKEDEEIARLAGENALRFFRVLLDAGREINPDFRVLTRMESFYGEHDTLWRGLKDGLDIETASLIGKGWDIPYHHPAYPDSRAINPGTVYQNQMDKAEKDLLDELAEKNSLAHFYFSAGPHAMFEPLLGIPYPTLTYTRLRLLFNNGVHQVAHLGGTCPKELVPFNINHEICRYFQFAPEMDIDEVIHQLATRWAGEEIAGRLVEAWELTEKAILAFPNVTPLYSTHGFTWYRLWIRPLVPNFEAIPEKERAYYEDFMCTTPHNPNNVDLSRDVLFQLTTVEKSLRDVERMDRHVWKPMHQAIETLEKALDQAEKRTGADNIIYDQLIRLKALHCWFMTQRNVAAWIWGVHQYPVTDDEREKKRIREFLDDMIKKETYNTEELIGLLDSGVEFMALTDMGESPLIYGVNIKEHLHRRIELMNKHKRDEPYIDTDYMWKRSGDITA
jgi:hypothetical protein